MNELAALDALTLVALVATVLAAIANIFALQASGLRRTLMAFFFVASMALIVVASNQRTARQEASIREARLKLEMEALRQREAITEANRRLEQERQSYEAAVDAALAKMQADFRHQLEERARKIMADSQKTDEAYEQIRRLVEIREGLKRQDVRDFLQGEWTSSPPPERKGLLNILQQNACMITFTPTQIGLTPYEISEVNGADLFLRIFGPQGTTLKHLVLDVENDRFFLEGLTCVRKNQATP